MIKIRKIHKFIIYLFLLVCVISLSGTGLEDSRKLKLYHIDETAMIYAPESQLVSNDNVSNIKIAENETVVSGLVQNRVSRTIFSYRMSMGFLCALAFLSGLFLLAYRQWFMLYSSRYVLKIGYLIIYIQNMDGRKRFS